MFIIRLIIVYIVLLLIPVYISTVEAEGIHIGPAILRPAVSLNWSFDDNYQSQATNEKSASYLDVDPSIELFFEKGENKLSINVSSPVRYFSEDTDKKTRFEDTFYSTSIELNLPWRSYLKVYDFFTATKFSPFLTETQSNKNIDRFENHARFTLGTSIGSFLKLEGSYRNDIYKYKDNFKNLFFSLDLNNRKVDDFRGLVVLNVLTNDSLALGYSYQKDKFENDPLRGNRSSQYNFGFLHRFSNKLSLNGRIGIGNSVSNRSKGDTLSLGSTADIKITNKTSISLSVSKSTNSATQTSETLKDFDSSKNRSLSFFFDFKTSPTDRTDITLSYARTSNNSSLENGIDSVYNDIDFGISQKFFDKIFLNLNVSFRDNKFKSGANGQFIRRNNGEKRWDAGGDISFEIFKHTTTGVSFNHQERNSTFGNYAKNIISFRMGISY